MNAHPIADIFPLMQGAELAGLVEDVRAHGLREPIVLLNGDILDGRNRHRACEAANIEPRFETYVGSDPLAFVLSLNVHRRHLDESQRAMIAARLANLHAGRRSAILPIERIVTQPQAADMLKVGLSSLARAREVIDKGSPELARAVDRGEIPVSVAADLSRASVAVQRAAVATPLRAGHVAKQERRQEREVDLGAKQAALPAKRYGVILADCEWRFEVYSRDTGMDRAADNHYPTSDLETLKARDVASIAAEDCVLFLWATAPMLPQALEVMKAWRFTYKSQAVWAKDKVGTGYWFRNQHELLLVGTRGSVPAPAPGTQVSSLIASPVRRHSQKPDDVYELIEAYFPSLPRIELNARQSRLNWDSWGFEA